jgi:hypothetical protein
MGKFDIETFLFGLRIELKLETEFDAVDSARSKVDFVGSEFELEIGSLSVVADSLDGWPSLEQMTNGDGVTGCVWSLLSTKTLHNGTRNISGQIASSLNLKLKVHFELKDHIFTKQDLKLFVEKISQNTISKKTFSTNLFSQKI